MRCGRESRSKHQLPLSTHAPVFHWDLFFSFPSYVLRLLLSDLCFILNKKGDKSFPFFFPFLQRPVFRVVQRNEGLFIAGPPLSFRRQTIRQSLASLRPSLSFPGERINTFYLLVELLCCCFYTWTGHWFPLGRIESPSVFFSFLNTALIFTYEGYAQDNTIHLADLKAEDFLVFLFGGVQASNRRSESSGWTQERRENERGGERAIKLIYRFFASLPSFCATINTNTHTHTQKREGKTTSRLRW